MPDLVNVTRALLSVSDKRGIEAFARGLVSLGVEIVSTGGTARLLTDAGIPVTPIDRLTNFPEMMDGRVKTLHPKVHGGLLALRDDPAHAAAMREHGISPIDLVGINLYPFEATIAREGATRDEAIEQIDIGGPAMIRSGSKNHAFVAVLTDPAQYGPVLAEMEVTQGCTSLDLRKQLAAAAFRRTADYDAAIADFLARDLGGDARFPDALHLRLRRLSTLRYGENPHQAAAVYADPSARGPSVISAQVLHGKELSYNNLNDAAAALELVTSLRSQGPDRVAACVIKHANPCGAAIAPDALSAADRAIAGDPLAAFGGILALAGTIDLPAAQRLCAKDLFLEVLLAEAFEHAALDALRSRWQNLRILATGPLVQPAAPGLSFRMIRGGALAQEPDTRPPTPDLWTLAAGPRPDPATLRAAAALELIARAMTSNAIAIGGLDGNSIRLFGGGVGQVDRVTACRLAIEKAGHLAKDAIAVSDAFFPFPDGPRVLIDAGVKTIVHPGGSKRDQETFDLCTQRGVSCLITGVRRFRH